MDFLNSSIFTLDGESEQDTTSNSQASDESSSRAKGKVAVRRRYSESSEESIVDASEESWYEEDSFVVNDEEEIEYETDATDDGPSGSDNEAEDAEEDCSESGSEVSDEEEEQSFSDEERSSESAEDQSPFLSSEAAEARGKSSGNLDSVRKAKKQAPLRSTVDDALLRELYPELNIPAKKSTKKTDQDSYDDNEFIYSLDSTDEEVNKYASKRYFERNKDEFCRRVYSIFNKHIFNSQLPEDLPIEWNPRLLKTAGYFKRRAGVIELSTKVCDSPARVRDTLLHEMCHAAVAKIDDVDEKHGKNFRKWGRRCGKKFPRLPPVERCHSYKINTKYTFICRGCLRKIGRHTKSLKACPSCGGEVDAQRNGSTENATPRTPTKFALFVKENYQKHRTKGCTHAQVMKVLSAEYKATPVNGGTPAAADGADSTGAHRMELSFAELMLDDKENYDN
ncbi:Acidic repeat-containing protein [Aphelenchoides avenae]|nr:Acidic repeat-containing protein [Aphelenchus avenae]